MSKFKNLCEIIISKGLLRAMASPLNVKATCSGCGYVLPKYPGKYTKCPLCNNMIVQHDPNPSPNQDGGELEIADEEPTSQK